MSNKATDEKEHVKLEKWKKKRKITTYLAMFHASIVGTEYSSIFISVLFYLNHILHAENANFFYGMIIGSMYTSSIIASTLFGKYMDKMRNARYIVIFTGILGIIGNLLYSLPYSPWLLVVGRFLCGFTDATLPVMTGEFTRCYDKVQLSKVLANYQMVYICSFAIGPCTPLLLQGLHYQHWPIILDQSNAIAILLMFIQLIFTVLAYFLFSNLTEELGYQEFMQENKRTSKNTKDVGDFKEMILKPASLKTLEKTTPLKSKKTPIEISDMFTDFDVSLLVFACSFSCFICAMLDLIVSMVCVYVLSWTLAELSIAISIGLAINATSTLVFYRYLKGNLNVYFAFCISTIMPLICMSLLVIVDQRFLKSFPLQMMAVTSIMMLAMSFNGLNGTCGRLLLFSLIPSHSSSACEGVRAAGTRLFAAFAFYSATVIYAYLAYALFLFIFVQTVVLICFYVRWKTFVG